ncbi:MAG: hypothetical protein JO007_01965 [Alphaproteobacteria bacterium]|nr:hypothetical protein [Alphaproteobacteria bacterium]
MTELQWLSVAAAARAIATRKLSPVELTTALLERIGRLDPKLNVFIRLDGDAAIAAAKAPEAEIAAGRRRGLLHGVPVGIKDIIDVAGLPTTCHSRVLIDNVATADAMCVARLHGCAAPARLCLASSRPTNSQLAAPALRSCALITPIPSVNTFSAIRRVDSGHRIDYEVAKTKRFAVTRYRKFSITPWPKRLSKTPPLLSNARFCGAS